ncbi:unnamed protein product [Knipowitschia caucasica]|uniref:Small integral membrane protein 8 n=1 Tax=Knipowitschia caucasica TaxID=637954 RepID=A0AAV2K5S3_KNICA
MSDTEKGRPAEGRAAEGRPAEGRAAEGRPAEGRPAEGRPAEGRPAEGRPAEGRPAEGYRSPGLRGAKTTTLFRAVNPELFIKPNKTVMGLGLLSITLCVGYLGYMHATKENQQQLYEAIDSEGERSMRRKTSKWD